MNVLVINGSPKGDYSITLQTLLYLSRKYPADEFKYLNAGARIRSLEKSFDEARELILWCDIIIFSYPVYTFIAPSQLHRFIELMKAEGLDLSKKYITQLTTSKHFYDITAHRYIEENTYDLGAKYIKGLSADMEDLLTERGRAEAENFYSRIQFCLSRDIYENPPTPRAPYTPTPVTAECERLSPIADETDVLILTDAKEDEQLQGMIARFRARLPYNTRLVNINEFPFSGGCLGCFRCAVSEKCVYKDGFDSFLRENIQSADAIVYAFKIKDHSMGSRFKMYDDRNFCNGHRTVTVGMPVGYLVSGEYSAEENLKTVIEGRAEVGGNFLAWVASDEGDTDGNIDKLCATLDFALKTHYTAPRNFLGVGGMKIFRDLIYQMRGMMRADHKFYKKAGIYDFPQKKKLTSLKMYLVGFLLGNEKILAKMGNKMNEGMLAPYKKLFDKMDKRTEKSDSDGE